MSKDELLLLLESWEHLSILKRNGVDLTPQFPLLMEIALEEEGTAAWRAVWVADKLAFKNERLIFPYARRLITLLPSVTHTGKKRQFLRMISRVPVDSDLAAPLFDYCQGRIFDPGEPVAVKAFALQVMYNISGDQKELKPEVLETARQMTEIFPEAGIQARCRNLIRRLGREIAG